MLPHWGFLVLSPHPATLALALGMVGGIPEKGCQRLPPVPAALPAGEGHSVPTCPPLLPAEGAQCQTSLLGFWLR